MVWRLSASASAAHFFVQNRSGYAGHLQVEHDHIGPRLIEVMERIHAVLAGVYREVRDAERAAKLIALHTIIVDDEKEPPC
jgi:hypothetical protein